MGRAPAARLIRASSLETGLIVLGLVLLFAVAPHEVSFGDDTVRFGDIELLLHHGELANSPYSLVTPLFSAPFLLLGEVLGSPKWWAAHFNAIVVALGLLAAFVLVRDRGSRAFLRTFTLVFLFASLATEGMRTYGPEMLTTVLVALGTLAVATGRHTLLGWSAIVIGVVNIPAAFGGMALIVAVQAFRTRRLRPVLALGAAALLILGEAWLRRGSPFTTGYEGNHGVTTVLPYSGRSGFSYPFVLGVASILFSFGRGLMFFTPGLLLWLGARTRRLVPAKRTVILQLAFVVGLVLVYAKWWAWYGGLVWGPRYFIFAAVPASVFLATRLRSAVAEGEGIGARAIVLGLLVLSSWVGLAAALGDLHRLDFCGSQGYQLEAYCWYTPEYSAPWWLVGHYPGSATGVVLGVSFFAVFAYLAAPVAVGIVRELVPHRRRWAHGWRL
jgi:hypothetical protein